MDEFPPYLGVVAAWLLRVILFLASLLACSGCSMSAAWSSPAQQQVTSPTAPVTQTAKANNSEAAEPPDPASLIPAASAPGP